MCFYILELKCIKKDRYHSEISNLLTSIYIQVILSNYVSPLSATRKKTTSRLIIIIWPLLYEGSDRSSKGSDMSTKVSHMCMCKCI